MRTDNITENFRWSDAADRHGNIMPPEIEANVETMAAFLEKVREAAGCDFRISSWFRSPQHPEERRKDRSGAHSTGFAVDILCYGHTAMLILKAALSNGVAGIGVSQTGPRESRYIHLDIAPACEHRPRPHIWSYCRHGTGGH